jgi:hypothetical protein
MAKLMSENYVICFTLFLALNMKTANLKRMRKRRMRWME